MRAVLRLAALGVALGAVGSAAGTLKAIDTPNFIILFADDMGYSQPSGVSDRSDYAGDKGSIRTPALDRLAAGGVAFTSWYSAFHVCSPSRAAMMTGRLSVRAGIGYVGAGSNGVFTAESVGSLPDNETTIAEALKPTGYMTGMVGKWHLGQQPAYLPPKRGFDYYYGIPFSCDMGISAWSYSNASRQPFQARPLPLFNCTNGPGAGCDDTDIIEQPANLATLTARYADASIKFILGAQAAGKPFLLYLPFNHVHSPNFASKDFCNASERGPVGNAAEEMDTAVGHIADAVTKAGLDESTVYFFTSDNGAPLANDQLGNGPLRDGKTTTWEGGIREPAFVRWAGTVKGGRVTDTLAGTYDIFATILAMAKVAPPVGVTIDGKDLTPVLMDTTGTNPGAHRCIYHYWSPQITNPTGGLSSSGIGAVRCGQYKAHFYVRNSGHGGNHTPTVLNAGPQDPAVVFDLDADMSESHPLLASDPKGQAALAEITQALKDHIATVPMVPNQMVSAGQSCQATRAPSCVGGNDLAKAVCKDIDSKSKYPDLPTCTSNPEFYGTAACRSANKECIARCMPETPFDSWFAENRN